MWTAFLALVVFHFPNSSAVLPIVVTVSMICLSALTDYLWLGRSKARVQLQSKLLGEFFSRRIPRSNFLAASFKVINLTVLLLTAYVLTASLGLLLAVSVQSVGCYRAGEEIYRLIPGYKCLLEERPVSALWVAHKPPNLAQLESATKRVYGDESKEVGYFYRECADKTDSRQDRQRYLKEALRRFREANLATDSIECMVVLAHKAEDFDRMPQAYAEVYPLVLQHPSFFSCHYLEHMAHYLKRPQTEIDRLNAAERALAERGAPMRFVGDCVMYLIFIFPLFAAISVVVYRVSLPLFGCFWTAQLKSSRSLKRKCELLSKLTTVELLRGKLERANRRSKEFIEMVEGC